ncbi:golgin subfamily A member 6-like protein 1 [Harpegnathos saltator]|nr:golgin subfamily A member 6-like protein 1 [Harpegnathos saltator]
MAEFLKRKREVGSGKCSSSEGGNKKYLFLERVRKEVEELRITPKRKEVKGLNFHADLPYSEEVWDSWEEYIDAQAEELERNRGIPKGKKFLLLDLLTSAKDVRRLVNCGREVHRRCAWNIARSKEALEELKQAREKERVTEEKIKERQKVLEGNEEKIKELERLGGEIEEMEKKMMEMKEEMETEMKEMEENLEVERRTRENEEEKVEVLEVQEIGKKKETLEIWRDVITEGKKENIEQKQRIKHLEGKIKELQELQEIMNNEEKENDNRMEVEKNTTSTQVEVCGEEKAVQVEVSRKEESVQTEEENITRRGKDAGKEREEEVQNME